MKIRMPSVDNPDINMASLIDMVFLLLVYFLVSSTFYRSEADLSIRLPGMLAQAQSVDLPDEQIIEIRVTGHVILNNRVFDDPESRELPELVSTLIRYRLSSEHAGNPPLITIRADGDTPHQRVIDVLNACAKADIENVTFHAEGGY